VLLYRLLREEQDYEHATGGPAILLPQNPCEEVEVESGEARKIRHIFLTLSPQLCLHVKKEYQKMVGVSNEDDNEDNERDGRAKKGGKEGSDGGKEENEEGGEDWDDDQSEEGAEGLQDEEQRADQLRKGLPCSYLEMEDDNFPAFITFVTLLELLDRCLQRPFFNQERTKARMVTGDIFSKHYWPKFSDPERAKFNDVDVFSEITSNIKGKKSRPLTKSEYCALSKSASAVYSSYEDYEAVYSMYLRYEGWKDGYRAWDLGDAVGYIDEELEAKRVIGGRRLPRCHRVYVDEVQDLTEAQISLLRHLNEDIMEGYAFAGDTAQCITQVKWITINVVIFVVGDSVTNTPSFQ